MADSVNECGGLPRQRQKHVFALTIHSKKSLGLAKEADVKLPANTTLEEWLATGTVESFNQLIGIYSNLGDHCTDESCPIMAAGAGFRYAWRDDGKDKKPMELSAPDYILTLFDWAEKKLNDRVLFPVNGKTFPKNYIREIKTIFKRLFRVYAHLYHAHFHEIAKDGLAAMLNSCFKYFMLFAAEFNLISKIELEPMKDLLVKWKIWMKFTVENTDKKKTHRHMTHRRIRSRLNSSTKHSPTRSRSESPNGSPQSSPPTSPPSTRNRISSTASWIIDNDSRDSPSGSPRSRGRKSSLDVPMEPPGMPPIRRSSRSTSPPILALTENVIVKDSELNNSPKNEAVVKKLNEALKQKTPKDYAAMGRRASAKWAKRAAARRASRHERGKIAGNQLLLGSGKDWWKASELVGDLKLGKSMRK